MTRAALFLVLLTVLAGCASAPKPATVPTPEGQPRVPVNTPPQPAESTHQHRQGE